MVRPFLILIFSGGAQAPGARGLVTHGWGRSAQRAALVHVARAGCVLGPAPFRRINVYRQYPGPACRHFSFGG